MEHILKEVRPHSCFDSVQNLADTAAKTEGLVVEGRIAGLQPELLRACNKVPSPECAPWTPSSILDDRFDDSC